MFSRKRGGPKHVRPDDAPQSAALARSMGDGPAPEHGPYDSRQARTGVQRLDLGRLLIPAVEGVEVRVQANPDGGVEQIVLVHGNSALQLGVFAAPRSEGIWDEVREDIRKQLYSDGVAAEEIDGRYGVELKARVRTPDGLADIRFVGIDGPRWMVRAVFQGPAATDPAAARPLDEALRGLVVDRGGAAMPVREPLPLRLPREVAEQAAAGAASAGGEQSVSTPPVASGSSDSGTDAEPRKPAPAGRGTAAGRRRPSPRPRRG